MKPSRAAIAVAIALAALASRAEAADPQVVDSARLSPRLEELTLRTSELATPTHVRVLLPSGYRGRRGRRFPVLYLLHGGADDYRSWTRPGSGAAERLTAGLPLIVVMPDAGRGGWYTDWYNNGRGGLPRWESWHVGRLIRFVDRRYRTRRKPSGRAIAGLSMGGFGALSYAARHPDMFTAAVSLSGAVDTNTPPGAGPAFIDGLSALDGGPPGSLWGPRATEEVRWRAHNPWDLAENLRGLSVTLRTGNGQPGGRLGGAVMDALETAVHAQGLSLHERLDALGIRHIWDDYGPGSHSWPYWNRGLQRTLPTLMRHFRRPAPPSSPFTFTAVEPRYAVHGWSVRLVRPALEFSRLEEVRARGFTVAGSGRATVTTARLFGPRKPYRVLLRGHFGERRRVLRTDRRGRLRVTVPLGPGNPVQQYAPLARTRVFRTRVTIAH